METLSDWFGCTCNCCSRKELAVKEFIRKLDSFCDLMRDGTRDAIIQSKILQIQLKLAKLAGDKLT